MKSFNTIITEQFKGKMLYSVRPLNKESVPIQKEIRGVSFKTDRDVILFLDDKSSVTFDIITTLVDME